jgi:hypothetical protein
MASRFDGLKALSLPKGSERHGYPVREAPDIILR